MICVQSQKKNPFCISLVAHDVYKLQHPSIDLFKSCMELCNIIPFTIAGFTLSYTRWVWCYAAPCPHLKRSSAPHATCKMYRAVAARCTLCWDSHWTWVMLLDACCVNWSYVSCYALCMLRSTQVSILFWQISLYILIWAQNKTWETGKVYKRVLKVFISCPIMQKHNYLY